MLPLFSWYVFGCPKQGGMTAIGQKSLPKRSFSAIFSYSPLLSRLVLSATQTVFPPFLDERSRNKGTVKCQKQPKYGSQSGPSPIYHIYIYIYTHARRLPVGPRFFKKRAGLKPIRGAHVFAL